jgi:hypothetical protein
MMVGDFGSPGRRAALIAPALIPGARAQRFPRVMPNLPRDAGKRYKG